MTLIIAGGGTEFDTLYSPNKEGEEFFFVQEIAGKFKEALEDPNIREQAMEALGGVMKNLSGPGKAALMDSMGY
jgi:hypothetical protein